MSLAQVQSKRAKEFADISVAIRLMDVDWAIDAAALDSTPDFVISEGKTKFGLEHTQVCVDWASRSSGSPMRAAEAKRQKRLVSIARRWEECVGAPLNLSVSSRRTRYPEDLYHFDALGDEEILAALLESPVCSARVGTLFHVLLGDEQSGEFTDLIVRRGLRPLAEFIPSHMGWVWGGRAAIEATIEEKAKKLANYKRVAGDDVRLLIVADWSRNSGKADVPPDESFDLHGFNAVYFSTGVKAFRLKER